MSAFSQRLMPVSENHKGTDKARLHPAQD